MRNTSYLYLYSINVSINFQNFCDLVYLLPYYHKVILDTSLGRSIRIRIFEYLNNSNIRIYVTILVQTQSPKLTFATKWAEKKKHTPGMYKNKIGNAIQYRF